MDNSIERKDWCQTAHAIQ